MFSTPNPSSMLSGASTVPRAVDKSVARACEACRARKIGCVQDVSFSKVACKPCVIANRHCFYAEPSLKKRRKRTDARVAELEKTVEALSAALHGSKSDFSAAENAPVRPPPGIITESASGLLGLDGEHDVNAFSNQWSCNKTQFNALNILIPSSTPTTVPEAPLQLDVVSRGILPIAEVYRLFEAYKNQLHHYPDLILPDGSTPEIIGMGKPTLLLAILTAASGTIDGELNALLTSELRRLFAERAFMRGEKSVELVQSLLITSTWSYPPDKYDEVMFYQRVHMAASMALEIGLGRKTANSAGSSHLGGPHHINFGFDFDFGPSTASPSMNANASDGERLEECRMLVSCYIKCSGVSLDSSNPSMMRFSGLIADCVKRLECPWNAVHSDRRLAAWARLSHVMEDFRAAFSSDDPTVTISLFEPRVQNILRGFRDQLERWKENLLPGTANDTLEIYYQHCRIYMHVISMHLDYAADDFQLPYWVRTAVNPSSIMDLPSAYIDAVSTCSDAAHGLLLTFLRTETRILSQLPTVNFVRMIFAVTVLVKLAISARSPCSAIRRFVVLEELRVDHYLEELVVHLQSAVGLNRLRVPSIFLTLIRRLKSWYNNEFSSGLCPSCCLNKQKLWAPQASGTGQITTARHQRIMVSPDISVLSTDCIYMPICNGIFDVQASSQSSLGTPDSTDIIERSREESLGASFMSKQRLYHSHDPSLGTAWSQTTFTEDNELPMEAHEWLPDEMLPGAMS